MLPLKESNVVLSLDPATVARFLSPYVLVQGLPNPFSVTIESSKTVGNLKEAIFEKISLSLNFKIHSLSNSLTP